MTARTQTWTPDTCPGCSISVAWDDSQNETVRTHSYGGQVFSICADHKQLGLTNSALYTALMAENQRKNLTLAIVGTTLAGVDPTTLPWSFAIVGNNRILTVTLPKTVTALQESQVQAATDLQFGPGLVQLPIALAVA